MPTKKRRKLKPNDRFVNDWERPETLKTLPKETMSYELTGERYSLRAPAHVIAVARCVLERIGGASCH
jgi:hypothetical protein